jgi:hypothetical protein
MTGQAGGAFASVSTPGAAWWREPLAISDLQLTLEELRALGAERAAARLAELGFTVQELAFPVLPGYEGSYLRAPWTPDEYRAFIHACHAHGVRITPYLNVHGFFVELAEKYPTWAQRFPDGGLAIQGNGRWVPPCYNGPWRDFALDAIAKLVTDYPVDGLFLDGPTFFARTCYCGACAARFREQTGLALPEWEAWDDPAWFAFLRFRAETLARLLADIRARLDALRSDEHLILYMNNASLGPSWIGGRETRRLAPYLDILGNERANLFNSPPMLTPLWLAGAAVKILETQARRSGQPTVEYCCFRHLPWDYYGLPATEYRLHLAGVLANGAHPQVMGGLRYLDEPLRAVVRNLNMLQRRHPEVYCGSRSVANVALVWPQRTADFGGRHLRLPSTTPLRRPPVAGEEAPIAPGSAVALDEFYGWAELLCRSGLPYDVLDDEALEEEPAALERYATLVLPSAQCLSDRACAAIEAFVHHGGHLIATGTASLCDEWDRTRSDFRLAAVFGAHYSGELLGPLPIDYLELVADRACGPDGGALLAGIEREVIPAPPSAVVVQPGGATVLATHLRQMQTRYLPLERDPQPKAAILVYEYGKGTCVYLPGTFGAAYWHHHFPDYRRLLANAVAWRTRPLVTLRLAGDGEAVPAPETVEVTLRRAIGGEWLVHLVNHTGTMSRPIERVLPVQGLEVALPMLSHPRGSRRLWARALVSQHDLPVRYEAGVPVVPMPVLDTYEVLVLREEPAV